MSAPTVFAPEFAADCEADMRRWGDTCDEVGRHLAAGRHKGTRKDCYACVIVAALLKLGYPVLMVLPGYGPNEGIVEFSAVEFEGGWHTPAPARLPEPVNQFGCRWDDDYEFFPELVAA